MRRIIREEEPAKPSARVSTLAEVAATVAANRQSDPQRLRRLLRGELDWIVMKCLEKDRKRRYETANELARDLERYLRDEPVLAGPPSARYRFRKFARRNSRVLTAASAFVLLLVTAVVALTVALVAVNRERQEKQAALEAEGKRRKQAREALDVMSSHIIEDWLAKQPSLLPEQKQFLELALRRYEEFAADTGQEEESRAGVERAHYRVGFIRQQLGQWKEAEAAWERGRELGARLVADFPGVPDYRRNLARTHRRLGHLYSRTDRPTEAEATFRQGLTILRNLAAEFPGQPGYRQGLAITLDELGILLKNLGRFQEAEEVYGQALAIRRPLAADFPTVPHYRDDLAQTHLNLGVLLDLADRSREAEESLNQAVAIYKQLVADFPAEPRYRDQLATSGNNLGNVLRDARRHPEAEEVFRQTLTTQQQLVAEFPAVPDYRRGLAITLNNLGILLKNTDRAKEAEDYYGQALAVHKQLAADFPAVPNHQNEAAGAMVNLARVLLARKELHGARRLLEEAVPYHQAALKTNRDNPAYRNFYRNNRWRMAETLLELKEHAVAAEAAGQFLQAATQPPRDAYTAAGLLAGCVRLAAQDERLPESQRQELTTTYGDRALAALRQAVAQGAKEAARMKEDPSLGPLRPRADFQKLLAEWEAKSKP
jgi:tetratricopeptide (TPR) repeat protein